jgi:diguanylate cyclase (GGDEF)-like protein/PAS domain S-box-containing protein
MTLTPFNCLPLRKQIAAVCVFVSLLAVALVSTVGGSLSSRHLRLDLDSKAALYAQQLRRELAPVVAVNDSVTGREILASFALDPDVAGLAVYSAAGEAIAGVGRYPGHLSQGQTPDRAFEGTLAVVADVSSPERVTGRVYVSLSKARIHRSMVDMAWSASITAAAALLLAMALADPLAKRLTGRLSRIVDVATRIAHGEFTHPPIEHGSRDEIGVLATAVTSMSAELRRKFAEVEALNDVRHQRDLAALQQSERNFHSLFEFAPSGMALTDVETGRFLEVNDAFVAPTGYTREELLGMTMSDVKPGHDRAKSQVCADSLRLEGQQRPIEGEQVAKNGVSYAVLTSNLYLTEVSGRRVMWSIVQDISLRKAMESKLVDAAQRDKLTGLANRAIFMERLEKAVNRVRDGQQAMLAVLFLDFDRFKVTNDTLGHEGGDELLRQIARRLQGELRASDALSDTETGNVVSRFGGDEFLLLINDLKVADNATRIADRLLEALAPRYEILGSEVHSTASIGIVTSEKPYRNAEEIVRDADVAMYEAKRAGRACYTVFSQVMQTRLSRHATIESDLRRAIGTDQIYLVYQPIVELSTGKMVSTEALIRWNHPTLGVVSPGEFIPIAEESNLIMMLGQWVQKTACRAMATWRMQDPLRAPGTISVNLSRAELTLGGRLLEQVQGTLAEFRLPAGCLQFEVTEREVMRDPETFHTLLHGLQNLGVKIAMDDFGAGTSSLGYLRSYPFDTIKIDGSFMRDLASSGDVLAVLHATINLVENLGMASLAECVEEPAQAAILQSLGCRYAQGFLFSRPVSAELLMDAVVSENFAGSAAVEPDIRSAGLRATR